MLKKIPVSQLRLGMYVHAFEGSWLDHPFWRTRFLLNTQADLQAIRGGGIQECWIDLSRGAGPGDAPAPAPVMPAAAAAPALPVPPPPARVSIAEELQRASQLRARVHQAVMEVFSDARLGKALDTERCLPLVQDVASSVLRHPGALISLVRLKASDDYTYMHSVAVCALMVALARQLGLDEERAREAGLAGLLHDLGKAFMPPEVLNKPGKLTEAEFAIIKTHPQRGRVALEANASDVGEAALDVSLHHHEKMDGSGYPHGLAGEAIGLFARMGAVCDVYDAVTSNRAYKAAWDPAVSLQAMASWKGHFDTTVFQAFVRSVGIYPIGCLVRLESGRLAVVVEQSERSLVAPIVKVFYSTRAKMHVPHELVDLSRPGCSDRIAGRESPQDWGFKHLDQLWAGAAGVPRS
jgi:putative nucleotidyltransferase with HDIG domain